MGSLFFVVGEMGHNPYFSRWFSAMFFLGLVVLFSNFVTILILVDGFLQYDLDKKYHCDLEKSQSLF